jgi:hypothetical protein
MVKAILRAKDRPSDQPLGGRMPQQPAVSRNVPSAPRLELTIERSVKD